MFNAFAFMSTLETPVAGVGHAHLVVHPLATNKCCSTSTLFPTTSTFVNAAWGCSGSTFDFSTLLFTLSSGRALCGCVTVLAQRFSCGLMAHFEGSYCKHAAARSCALLSRSKKWWHSSIAQLLVHLPFRSMHRALFCWWWSSMHTSAVQGMQAQCLLP